MALISLLMVIDPAGFANRVVAFSEWRGFHWFEIFSRLLIGLAFLASADNFVYPRFAAGLGFLLIAVAFGLLVFGQARHRRFSLSAASWGRQWFRPAGLIGCVLGGTLVYLASLDA